MEQYFPLAHARANARCDATRLPAKKEKKPKKRLCIPCSDTYLLTYSHFPPLQPPCHLPLLLLPFTLFPCLSARQWRSNVFAIPISSVRLRLLRIAIYPAPPFSTAKMKIEEIRISRLHALYEDSRNCFAFSKLLVLWFRVALVIRIVVPMKMADRISNKG